MCDRWWPTCSYRSVSSHIRLFKWMFCYVNLNPLCHPGLGIEFPCTAWPDIQTSSTSWPREVRTACSVSGMPGRARPPPRWWRRTLLKVSRPESHTILLVALAENHRIGHTTRIKHLVYSIEVRVQVKQVLVRGDMWEDYYLDFFQNVMIWWHLKGKPNRMETNKFRFGCKITVKGVTCWSRFMVW